MRSSACAGGGGELYFYKDYDSFEKCLEIQVIFNDITGKYVPPRVNILYCLGKITLVFFSACLKYFRFLSIQIKILNCYSINPPIWTCYIRISHGFCYFCRDNSIASRNHKLNINMVLLCFHDTVFMLAQIPIISLIKHIAANYKFTCILSVWDNEGYVLLFQVFSTSITFFFLHISKVTMVCKWQIRACVGGKLNQNWSFEPPGLIIIIRYCPKTHTAQNRYSLSLLIMLARDRQVTIFCI